jgi:hypothetical protein
LAAGAFAAGSITAKAQFGAGSSETSYAAAGVISDFNQQTAGDTTVYQQQVSALWAVKDLLKVIADESAGLSSLGSSIEESQSTLIWVLVGVMALLVLLIGVVVRSPGIRSQIESAAPGPHVVCPFCAESVKEEAKVCRYCGRDIQDFINDLIKKDKELTLEATAEAEEEASERAELDALIEQDIRREHDEEILASKAKRRAFVRKPSTLVGGVIVVILAAAGISVPFVIASQNSVAAMVASNDWVPRLKTCDAASTIAVPYNLSANSKRVEIQLGDVIPFVWLTCVGNQIAIDPPTSSDANGAQQQDSFANFVVEGFRPMKGQVKSSKTDTYGNLTVTFSDNPNSLVITRE